MASTTKQTKLDFKVLRPRAKIKSEGETDTKPEPLPKTKIKTGERNEEWLDFAFLLSLYIVIYIVHSHR